MSEESSMKEAFSATAVIVPCYNEGGSIGKVIESLQPEFSRIICVDDGSKDDTSEEIRKHGAILVRHPVNLGQGGAIQTGIELARRMGGTQYLATFDADGQHQKKDLVAMVERLSRGDVDIIMGSRFLGKESIGMPKTKRALLKAATIFNYLSTGLLLTDAHNGLRVFSSSAARKINITMNGMAHASEILLMIKRGKLKYLEMPVEILYSEYSIRKGQSTLNSVNIIFDMLLRRIIP